MLSPGWKYSDGPPDPGEGEFRRERLRLSDGSLESSKRTLNTRSNLPSLGQGPFRIHHERIYNDHRKNVRDMAVFSGAVLYRIEGSQQ